jgi:nucleoid-associated protein YgaU
MAAISMTRVTLLLLPAVAVCGSALVFPLPHLRPEQPNANTAPTASKAAAAGPDQGLTTFGKAKAEAKVLASALTELPIAAENSDGEPTFDIARIDPTGEAVIAGRATPGATVELLRNGEVHDRAIADQSGQFALVPPKLPPGNYELPLRAKRLDGKQVTSTQSVAVALELKANEQPVVALITPNTATTGSVPLLAIAPKPSEALTTRAPRLAAANGAVLPAKNSTASVVRPGITTATVSRGDSLWRISQRALGGGSRYSIIYRANKDQISNPNLIYPGQIFVLSTQ